MEQGERRWAVAIGQDTSDKPLVAPLQGHCDGLHQGLRVMAYPIGQDTTDKPLLGWSKANAADPGPFELGQRLFATIIGADTNDKPLLGATVVQCGGNPPFSMCGCEVCCTLQATVQFAIPQEFPNPSIFGGSFQAEMQCGRSITVTHCILCQDPEVPEEILGFPTGQQWSGGEGSYTSGGTLYEWRTEVWATEVMSDGPFNDVGAFLTWTGNFKIFFAATEWTITEEGEDPVVCCSWEYGVNAEWTSDPGYFCGGGWGFLLRRFGNTGGCVMAVKYVESPDIPYPENQGCPEGYNNANPEGTFYDASPPLSLEIGSACYSRAGSFDGCAFGGSGPLYLFEEDWICPGIHPPCFPPCDCEDQSAIVRLTIQELCDPDLGICDEDAVQCPPCMQERWDLSALVSDCGYMSDCLSFSGWRLLPINDCNCLDRAGSTSENLDDAESYCLIDGLYPEDAACEGDAWEHQAYNSGTLFCEHNTNGTSPIDPEQDSWYVQINFACWQCTATGATRLRFCANVNFIQGVDPGCIGPMWTAVWSYDEDDFSVNTNSPYMKEVTNLPCTSYNEYDGQCPLGTDIPVTKGCPNIKISGLWTRTCVDVED